MGVMLASSPEKGRAVKTKSRPDTPFPLKQLLILSLARFAEPIAFMSIFPYIYYMIRSFNITTDDSQISVYAGMVTSSFMVAECSCSAMWGRLSDRIGRKPVLMIGLGGTGISMLAFGFARSLPVALGARFIGGLLNGNGGVLQTMVAEVVTVKEHQPRAYTFLPLTWGLGSVVGSFLGGMLADPVANYPDLFPNGNWLLEEYPFLLPNLFASTMVVFGVIIASLFFQETHPTIKFRRDRGTEFGDLLVRAFTRRFAASKHQRSSRKPDGLGGYAPVTDHDEEESELLKDEIELVDSPATPSTPTWRNSVATLVGDEKESHQKRPLSNNTDDHFTAPPRPRIRDAFTTQVILNILAYGLLAFHTIALDQLIPVYLSLPPSTEAPHSLIQFHGGLGMSSLQIGWIFSGMAFYSMFFQLFLAPAIIRRLGYLRCFQLAAFVWPLIYVVMPYITVLSFSSVVGALGPAGPSDSPTLLQWIAIAFACMWRSSWASLSYLTILILLTNSVKESGQEAQMGVVNGMSASFAAGARAIGPTVAGWLFNVGEGMGYAVLVWWLVAVVACLGAFESVFMREGKGADVGVQLEDDGVDDENDDASLVDGDAENTKGQHPALDESWH